MHTYRICRDIWWTMWSHPSYAKQTIYQYKWHTLCRMFRNVCYEIQHKQCLSSKLNERHFSKYNFQDSWTFLFKQPNDKTILFWFDHILANTDVIHSEMLLYALYMACKIGVSCRVFQHIIDAFKSHPLLLSKLLHHADHTEQHTYELAFIRLFLCNYFSRLDSSNVSYMLVKHGHLHLLKHIVETIGKDMIAKGNPLSMAIKHGQTECVDYLIDHQVYCPKHILEILSQLSTTDTPGYLTRMLNVIANNKKVFRSCTMNDMKKCLKTACDFYESTISKNYGADRVKEYINNIKRIYTSLNTIAIQYKNTIKNQKRWISAYALACKNGNIKIVKWFIQDHIISPTSIEIGCTCANYNYKFNIIRYFHSIGIFGTPKSQEFAFKTALLNGHYDIILSIKEHGVYKISADYISSIKQQRRKSIYQLNRINNKLYFDKKRKKRIECFLHGRINTSSNTSSMSSSTPMTLDTIISILESNTT